ALDSYPELRAQARATHERLTIAFAGLGAEAKFTAAAAWSLVHGLAHLTLDGHLENDEDFARKVLGAIRFAAALRPITPAGSPSAAP
ncbi:MAG: hypothetical protein ACRDH5_15110, partial [bacterium]